MNCPVTHAPSPEVLAQHSSSCRLCRGRIIAGNDYIAKLPGVGWVHALCAAGYRRVLTEHEEGEG